MSMCDSDDLGPSRGVGNGIALSLIVWAVIAAAVGTYFVVKGWL